MHTAKHIEIDEEPKRGRGWLIALAVVVVAAALGFGGYLFWLQRDVVVYLNGEPVFIKATKAVIVATGGFEHNDEIKSRTIPTL